METAPDFAADLRLSSVRRRGLGCEVSVAATNRGSLTWEIDPTVASAASDIQEDARGVVRLGYRLEARDGSLDDSGRAVVLERVPPGESTQFVVHTTLSLGVVALRLDLLREGVAWLHAAGEEPLVVRASPGDRIRGLVSWMRLPSLLELVVVRPALLLSYGLNELVAGARRRLWSAGRIPESREAKAAEVTTRDRPGRRPRLLVVAPYYLAPANHGGATRITNLLRHLARDCDLFVLSLDARHAEAQRREIGALANVFIQPIDREAPACSMFDAPSVRQFYCSRAAARLESLIAEHDIDVVQLEYTELASYLAHCRGARTVLVEIDVAFRSLRRRLRVGVTRFERGGGFGATLADCARLQRFELEGCRRADVVHVMSAADRDFLGSYVSSTPIRVVPNGVDCAMYRASENVPSSRCGVLFVGNFEHVPNLDGLEWLLDEIWPRVRQLDPEATLDIVGHRLPDRFRELDGANGIRAIGSVEDVLPFYHRARVLAAPIRAGSGTRLKLLEAFAAGVPAVATSLAAEGLEAANGEHLLLRDDAETFAVALAELLADPALGARVAESARALAERTYDWRRAARTNLETIHRLMS